MEYIIFVSKAFSGEEQDQEIAEDVIYSGPVEEADADYLRKVIGIIKPLSDEEYMTGPAVILHTAARFSYVLDEHNVYWCIEWEPGFVVVRVSDQGELGWTAIRSPVPDFGGREATEEELAAYDYGAENPQYNLVFHPWDAQFDEQDREWGSFQPASKETVEKFDRILDKVNQLGEIMQQKFSGKEEAWAEQCQTNLDQWLGEGVRLE